MNTLLRRILVPLQLGNLKNLAIDYIESLQRLHIIKAKKNINSFKRVRISVKNSSFNQYIKTQSAGRLGLINKTVFVTSLYPDLNVVINDANPCVPLKSKLKENWLIHIEPPGYIQDLGYNNEKLLSKFTRVYTCDPNLYTKGGKYIASPPFVHWHLGNNSYTQMNELVKYDYDFLKSQITPPNKTSNLVAINSNINDLPGHRLRSDFIRKLCELNFNFILYGGSKWKNFKQYVDSAPHGKWPIYSESRYVLVIENEVAPYYWTEKITDTILCWSMPIYYGSTNISDYLPKGSYIAFDITDANAIPKLEEIIKSNYYESNIENLAKARELILEKYNLLNFIESELSNCHSKI